MERILKITLDLMKGPSYDLGTLFTQKDVQSHYLQLEFKDKNLDFTNKKLKVNFIKANNTIVFTNIDHIENVNKILIPANALDVVGELQIEFVIYSSVDNFVLTSNKIVKVRVVQTSHGRDLDNIPGEEILEEFQEAMKKFLLGALPDNSIPASKLKTSTNADKIQMINLSDEVKQAMSGKAPVTPTLTKGSVVREYIADGAVDISKMDNSMFHKEYFLNINKSGGQIQFQMDNINATTSDVFEIEWLAKEKTSYYFRSVHSTGATDFNNKVTITEITNGIYKHYFKANLQGNANSIRTITYGDAGSGQVYKFNGEYYDFSIKINGKAIPFTFKNTSEEISLRRVVNNAIDFEETLKLINEKKVSLNDYNVDDKKVILGKADDEYTTVIEKFQSTITYIADVIGLPNIKLKAGKYQITAYNNRVNFKLYCFPTSRGGEILQVITLENLMKDIASEVIIEQDCYIGIQEFSENIGRSYWSGNGKTYKTNFYHTTQLFDKGQVLLVNQGDGAISSKESYTCPLEFKYTSIYTLNAKSNTKDITTYINNSSKHFGEIASFEISEIPAENKQTLYRIENLKNILYNENFRYLNLTDNTMNKQTVLTHTPYNSIDEYTYRVKFKLLDLNTSIILSSYKGEFESGGWKLDTSTKILSFYDGEAPLKSMQTLEINPFEEEKVGTYSIPDPIQVTGITFEIGNMYIIELIRSGLKMFYNIYNITRDEQFLKEIGYVRLHGGKSVFIEKGSVEIKLIEEKTPLINGTEAIFIGDSITEGLSMGTNDISKRWASLLRDKYFKGNALCCGMGWGTTDNVLDVLNNIKSYCNYIKYYFIMIGTNQSDEKNFEKWSKEIVEIYNKIKELGGIPVIICPPLNRNVSSTIPKMRDFILEKGWDTIRMDIATSTGDGVTFDNSLSTDGTHFNANGNQKMYERALIDLKKIM